MTLQLGLDHEIELNRQISPTKRLLVIGRLHAVAYVSRLSGSRASGLSLEISSVFHTKTFWPISTLTVSQSFNVTSVNALLTT